MKIRELFIPVLLAITLAVSVYGCVMVVAVYDNVEQLQEEDERIMAELQSNLNPPDSIPVLSDSLTYYKTEKKRITLDYDEYWFTIHRFFFKRANYTDSLYNGFSIVVADFGSKGIIIENQDNVTLSSSNIGEPTVKWQSKLNMITSNKETYSDFSDKGLRVKTYVRSNKI